MAIKIKIPKGGKGAKGRGGSLQDPVLLAGLIIFLIGAVALGSFFAYFYVKYDRIITERFRTPVFTNAAKIYALPKTVRAGDKSDVKSIVSSLKQAGYSDAETSTKKTESLFGSFRLISNGVEIDPGPESYHSPEAAKITFAGGRVQKISSQGNDLSAYELEPELVTALFNSTGRSKRELVKYGEIPKVMVDAVMAIEDRRFFEHSGVNFIRMAEAFWIDVTRARHEQGGSTITMQLSRGFFLTPEKTIRRKLTEMLIAEELEQKFSKQQIFEFYGNWVNLGQRGSFAISGFAEACHAYFGKDLKDITLPEAALLAGIIQGPSRLSPYRHPERALERRNLVLDSMVETHAITREQADKAKAAPLKLAPPNVEASDAPYFVDMVRDALSSKLSEHDLNDESYRIYTTLVPDLQRAAAEAVESGMKLVDEQVKKLRTKKTKVGKKFETHVVPGPQAQVAMVVLDPHTGAVLALVGGRDYGFSQLNHSVSKRPTGSIFKPFVYAAAMNTGINGSPNVITPASIVPDEPTTFAYGDQIYEPRNYKEEYHGDVTLRYALAMSLNNATVKVAEEVGYDKVAELAKAAGITSVRATPAAALGSYDATPLDMAGAYTSFSNGGQRLAPILVSSVRNTKGDVISNFKNEQKQVLDPRVAYIMTNMMEGVINYGLGYTAVRLRGFLLPAAGKTGSSHDGWFAGFTSNLLCVVWVGYDDYSDIRLSGAMTAAPIWTEFMKRASKLPEYGDMKAFGQPSGVVDVQLDKATNRLATPQCPDDYTAAFIVGTEPRETCEQQGSGAVAGFFNRVFGGGSKPVQPGSPTANGPIGQNTNQTGPPGQYPANGQTANGQAANGQSLENANPPKKKGFFGKIAGVFKEDKSSAPAPKTPDIAPTPPR